MTESKYTIRRAEQRHMPDIYRLSRDFAKFQHLPEEMLIVTMKDLEDNLSSWFQCLVLEYKAADSDTVEVIGYALWTYTFDSSFGRVASLNDLYVTSGHRGCGGGLSLITHLTKICDQQGCVGLTWLVHRWNKQAITFYSKLNAINVSEIYEVQQMGLMEDDFNKLVNATPKVGLM